MIQTISAVYEKGVLRPLAPLRLVEHQRVQLQIWPENRADAVDTAIENLIAAGMLTPPSGQPDTMPPSDEERYEAAAALGMGDAKPASEMIIEDRGAR
jgi:predicted DNA-binding antitoxin AbrB/MazE fold protein